MKKIILAIFVLSTFWANAQNTTIDYDKYIEPLNQKIESLKIENGKLKTQITTLFNNLSKTNVTLDSLRNQAQANRNAITQTATQLGIQIKETGNKNAGKITEVSESLSKNSLYGIIGVLSAVLLSALLYWLLSKRQKSDKSDFINQLSKTKSSIEESLVNY